MILFLQCLIALSPVVFLIGLVKPKWLLFWMKEPDRLWASSLGLFLFMGAVTAYSEMRVRHRPPEQVREHQQHQQQQQRSPDRQNELQLDR